MSKAFSTASVIGLALFASPAAGEATTIPYAMTDTEQAAPAMPAILPLRAQADWIDANLRTRLDTIVPALMREQGVDMWIVTAREYFEDPVTASMLNAENFHARRRTILVFIDPGAGKPVERLTVSRYGLGGNFSPAWDPAKQTDQWQAVAELIAARNPRTIAVNTSNLSAFADGMTHSQYLALEKALAPQFRTRIVPAETLSVRWLESRTQAELELYPRVARMAHALIGEAFSRKVITPGETTTDDVVWWYRQRMSESGIGTWFQPSVAIQRQGAKGMLEGDEVIRPGDLLWTDFGITHMRLNTDTQHLAYVLKPGETEAPAGLRAGLAQTVRVRDFLRQSFRSEASGNEVLAATRAKAQAAGIDASIYSHPLGFHGHGAGAAIGFWDNQNGDERGEYRIRPNTTWSIELTSYLAVPEWGGQRVDFRSEEDALFDGERVRFLDGAQTVLTLIPSE